MGLVVIVGPTGAGKTELSLRLAERVGADIVSADSQQVYRGMDIGTGKASAEEQARVPHHLLDVVDPDEEMTAARFIELADAAIDSIRRAGRPVVVAGGTMLYVRALLEGLFPGPGADEELRQRLREESAAAGLESLWQRLHAVDEESAARIHKTDERRLIRALEVFELTGVPLSEHHRRHQAQPPRYEARLVGVQPERETLYERINQRVLGMMEAGLLDEVRALRAAGYDRRYKSQQAIGYAELHQHLEGELPLAEAVAEIQKNSRRYARRQIGWYRGQEHIQWAPEPDAVDLEALERYLVGQADA